MILIAFINNKIANIIIKIYLEIYAKNQNIKVRFQTQISVLN